MKYHFNVIQFLHDYNIDFITSGKNVGRNSINIRCFNCDDQSYHLGIDKTSGIWHCWRCDKSGNFISLIAKLLNCGFHKAKKISYTYSFVDADVFSNSKKESNKVIYKNIFSFAEYPSHLKKVRDFCLSYLKKRHVPLEFYSQLFFYYSNGICGVVIPFFDSEDPSAYIVRYINHPRGLRYYKPPHFKFRRLLGGFSLLPSNISAVCLVEGPFDFFVCNQLVPTLFLCSSTLSLEQSIRLLNLNIDKVFICLDADDEKRDFKVEKIISLLPTIKHKEIINLPSGYDPNLLGVDKMKTIFRSICYDCC